MAFLKEDRGHFGCPYSWGRIPGARSRVLSSGWEVSEPHPLPKGAEGLPTLVCSLVCVGWRNPALSWCQQKADTDAFICQGCSHMPGMLSCARDTLVTPGMLWLHHGCSCTEGMLVYRRDALVGKDALGVPHGCPTWTRAKVL